MRALDVCAVSGCGEDVRAPGKKLCLGCVSRVPRYVLLKGWWATASWLRIVPVAEREVMGRRGRGRGRRTRVRCGIGAGL